MVDISFRIDYIDSIRNQKDATMIKMTDKEINSMMSAIAAKVKAERDAKAATVKEGKE